MYFSCRERERDVLFGYSEDGVNKSLHILPFFGYSDPKI
uniref:Uncharacterized protein n=1 Tax=Rhizophora mucronata TaxID=61149 RepID=A0A2P2J6Y4_RHIMU